MSIAATMSDLAGGAAGLAAGLVRVDAAATGALRAANTFRVVAEITPASRFVPRVEGTPGPFDRPSIAVGLFDRTTLADLVKAAGDAQHVALLTRVFGARTAAEASTFEHRRTGGFDHRATGGFDRTTDADVEARRVELSLIDLASRLRVGF